MGGNNVHDSTATQNNNNHNNMNSTLKRLQNAAAGGGVGIGSYKKNKGINYNKSVTGRLVNDINARFGLSRGDDDSDSEDDDDFWDQERGTSRKYGLGTPDPRKTGSGGSGSGGAARDATGGNGGESSRSVTGYSIRIFVCTPSTLSLFLQDCVPPSCGRLTRYMSSYSTWFPCTRSPVG